MLGGGRDPWGAPVAGTTPNRRPGARLGEAPVVARCRSTLDDAQQDEGSDDREHGTDHEQQVRPHAERKPAEEPLEGGDDPREEVVDDDEREDDREAEPDDCLLALEQPIGEKLGVGPEPHGDDDEQQHTARGRNEQ